MEAFYTDVEGNRIKLKPIRRMTDESPAGSELCIRENHLEIRKKFKGPFKAGKRGLPT